MLIGLSWRVFVGIEADKGGVGMQIHGLNKTTLLDYPEHVAATIFFGKCNFRCPFCQNGDLVLQPESQPVLEKEEVLSFLRKRKGILSGVCITGGEPTLEEELESFICEIKEIGYLVKLDTNGYRPEVIRLLLQEKMVDYIAMDIKNSPQRYAETAGVVHLEVERIRESIGLIMDSGIAYEFRTTVVKELHGEAELLAIGKEIVDARAYFLQGYQDSERVIASGFHAYTREEMERLANCVRPYVANVRLRGID